MKKLSGIHSNIKPFVNKDNWEEMSYPSKIDDWKTFEKNNPTIALNSMYTKEKKYFQLAFQIITQPVKNK